MGDQGRPGNGAIKFKTTFTNTIYEAMKRRGWKETVNGTDWDFMWADRQAFERGLSSGQQIGTSQSTVNILGFCCNPGDIAYDMFDTKHFHSWQRVNHFRNDRELCRKDLMVKNLKKRCQTNRKKNLQREGQQDEADSHSFWPTTYVLPGEYALFAEEFKRQPNNKWIMKPVGRSQGRGIFIVTKLSQISKWKSESRREKAKDDGPETYVVQKYITNPYLVAGRKFDVRLYVLVTSFTPITVWLYRSGFCRFSHARYSNATAALEDMEKHLTNVAIQKHTDNYIGLFGGKWDIRQLKLHLMGRHGVSVVDRLFRDIQTLILQSLLAVQQVMINDKHCFGLYGYDILFDEGFKPWLLEVNASPSLSASTTADRELKVQMLSNALDIIDIEGKNSGNETRVGGFDLIHSANLSVFGADGHSFSGGNSRYSTFLGTEIPEQHITRITNTSSFHSYHSGEGGGLRQQQQRLGFGGGVGGASAPRSTTYTGPSKDGCSDGRSRLDTIKGGGRGGQEQKRGGKCGVGSGGNGNSSSGGSVDCRGCSSSSVGEVTHGGGGAPEKSRTKYRDHDKHKDIRSGTDRETAQKEHGRKLLPGMQGKGGPAAHSTR